MSSGNSKLAIGAALFVTVVSVTFMVSQGAQSAIPRTADGKPNLQGIWKARSTAAMDVASSVEGGKLPYRPEAEAKRRDNFANRASRDPLASCFMPGVPRIMYLDYPFQIFQTPEHVALTFEWSQVFRLVYTDGKPARHQGIDSWMGDSRGHWEGDTLVVDVTGQNDQTWFDLAGNYHSEEMKLTERYTMEGPNTIRYEATVTDPRVFTGPWKISIPLQRITNLSRVLEFQCQAEKEEANGDFEREPRTWYPKK